jgi:hypothetical protein
MATLYRIWKTSNLTLDLEIHQHLGSLKHVINIIMWIRDTGCYIVLLKLSYIYYGLLFCLIKQMVKGNTESQLR